MWETIASIVGVIIVAITPFVTNWARKKLREAAENEERREQEDRDDEAHRARSEDERQRMRSINDRAQSASDRVERDIQEMRGKS